MTNELSRFEAVGYTWGVFDARQADDIGEMYRDLAYIRPIDPATGDYLQEVTINRATRHSVEFKARRSPGWSGGTQVYQTSGDSLTDAGRLLIDDALQAAAKSVPDLTEDEAEELRAEGLEYSARRGAWTAWRDSAYYKTSGRVAPKAKRAEAVARAVAAFEKALTESMGL